MQIAFGRVRRKTSLARREGPNPRCSHIFGLYYKMFMLYERGQF